MPFIFSLGSDLRRVLRLGTYYDYGADGRLRAEKDNAGRMMRQFEYNLKHKLQ